MATGRILVAQPLLPGVLDRVRELAGGRPISVVEPAGAADVDAELQAEVEVLFADLAPPSIASAPQLRWIQLGSHGYGQLAGLGLTDRVTVTNASGVNDIPIAEWCLMMILALNRDFPGMLKAQGDHRWAREAIFQNELRGKRLGILGYGNIGRQLAAQAQAFGLEVYALSRGGVRDRGLRYRDKAAGPEPQQPDRIFTPGAEREFLSGLDFLAITLPLTAATRGLVNAELLAFLPPTAYLLNPARAGIVDEQALLDALRRGSIAGAALDDHYRSPMPPDDPFWELPNTIVTSHISGSTASPHFLTRVWSLFCANLARWNTGQPLLNVITRADLEPYHG